MSEHSAIERAAYEAAGRAAGMHDPADAPTFIPAGTRLSPADAVAGLKEAKPHLFRLKDARDMTGAEYSNAKRRLISATHRSVQLSK